VIKRIDPRKRKLLFLEESAFCPSYQPFLLPW